MCGIAGIFVPAGRLAPSDRDAIGRMTEVIAHRGPDDSGAHLDDHLALGNRRLAVIDTSRNGRQPMSNEDGTVWISLNGEIYNFADLKKRFRLLERGHVFRSRTDTEVLVHLYEELGPDMVAELNGMFAYALWDARRRELHLARDPYGIKPLFYTWDGSRLLFGSEIKSILEHPSVARRVDVQALHDFLTFDYVPGEQTAFEGIHELPAAHLLSVGPDGSLRKTRYLAFDYSEDESIDEPTAVERARILMEQAVTRQLVADVPVGVLLSGGMDSSTIVALMQRGREDPVHTYSVGFEDPSFNEIPYARIVAERFGTRHREVVVTASMVRDLFPKYLEYIDEPYADGSAIPTYYVCQLAKDEVVVVLSGEGGDEVFAGYDTYAAYKASRWFRHVPGWIRSGLIAPAVNALPVSDRKLSLEFRLKRFLGGQGLSPVEAHLWWRIVLTEPQKLDLYTPELRQRLNPMAPVRHFEEVFARSTATDPLNRLLHVDASVFLPDDLMIKNDRMSMAHSLEARVPMTDPDLAGFMARVPARVKLPGLRTKHIMRRAMDGILPPSIVKKKKVGLEMPYSRWLKNELRDVLLTYCGRRALDARGLFRPDRVERLVQEHLAGRRDHGRALWGLLNYNAWLERYIP